MAWDPLISTFGMKGISEAVRLQPRRTKIWLPTLKRAMPVCHGVLNEDGTAAYQAVSQLTGHGHKGCTSVSMVPIPQ